MRVAAAVGVMLRARIVVGRVKLRGLLINGVLPHLHLGSNIVFVPEQLISVALLRRGQDRTLSVVYSTHYIDI
jgi:hypothetical protein